MALRIAVHELDKLVRDGLTQADFEATRNYLMKNVFLMTATQDQQLGYALDSEWYGIAEFTAYMRERLARLTRDGRERAIRKHLSATNLSVVVITKDAEGLKQSAGGGRVLADQVRRGQAGGPAGRGQGDRVRGSWASAADAVRITPVDEVFRAPGR